MDELRFVSALLAEWCIPYWCGISPYRTKAFAVFILVSFHQQSVHIQCSTLPGTTLLLIRRQWVVGKV